ncbi:MAG: HDOD domain-containing protein [Fibrobacterales bacterium]
MKNSKLTAMILENLPIPSQPKLLADYLEESEHGCDITKISKIVHQDMALSAAILRTVNSAAFNLSEKVTSIQQAIILLGLSNVTNLVYCFTLRESHQSDSEAIATFWNQSTLIAQIAAIVAQKHKLISSDEAFSISFLSNCGVPALAEEYQGYLEFYLNHAYSSDKSILTYEDNQFMVDHAVVGHFLSKKWEFPKLLYWGILLHHSENIEQDVALIKNPEIEPLITKVLVVLQYAEFLYTKKYELSEPFCWKCNKEFILNTISAGDHDALLVEIETKIIPEE